MSRILSIALIAFYALTLSQSYMPHVDYWMNQDFIASELCENKDKPALKCEGKCHLKKETKNASEDQQEGQEVSVRLMFEFFEPVVGLDFGNFNYIQQMSFPFLSAELVEGYNSGIFHPPKVQFLSPKFA